jgi:enhancing lycopene biosynthesis protein 2
MEKTGAIHIECPAHDFITDRDHKVITSPAYMHDTTPAQVFKGISGLAKELIEMA